MFTYLCFDNFAELIPAPASHHVSGRFLSVLAFVILSGPVRSTFCALRSDGSLQDDKRRVFNTPDSFCLLMRFFQHQHQVRAFYHKLPTHIHIPSSARRAVQFVVGRHGGAARQADKFGPLFADQRQPARRIICSRRKPRHFDGAQRFGKRAPTNAPPAAPMARPNMPNFVMESAM